MLLLKAPLDALRGLQQSSDLLVVLDQLNDEMPSTHRKGLAISVLLALLQLLLYSFKVMPLVAAVLVGCFYSGTALRLIHWDSNLCWVVSTASVWPCRKQ